MAVSAATERQFLSTVAPCMPDLRRYAMSLTRNAADAEDLLQDTMLRAALKLHLWKPGTNIMAWLIVMMRRLYLSNFVVGGRNKSEMVQIDEWDAAIPASQNQVLELRELEGFWSKLSKDHQEVLELVAIGGASYEEAAHRFHVPVGTIRSRLGRARICLREQTAMH
jgi:RNA polymerase sigma-70 factor (ECF subfamily)